MNGSVATMRSIPQPPSGESADDGVRWFEVAGGGPVTRPPALAACPNDFRIVLVRSGRGVVLSNTCPYEIRENMLFIVSPGHVLAWQLSPGARCEVVGFRREFFTLSPINLGILTKIPYLYRDGVDPTLRLSPAEADNLRQLFRQLRDTTGAEHSTARSEILRAYLTIILTFTSQLYEARTRDLQPDGREAGDPVVRTFRLVLEENFPRLLKVSDIAGVMKIAPSRLNERLRLTTGRSASDIIHERVLLEASRLLANSPLTIAEIAYALNFKDPSYFARFFRKHTEQPPRAYREVAHRRLAAQ
jgi:AraC family transcriptional regulator, transcriptional activator of pobA